MKGRELLTLKEVAEILRISPGSVYRLMAKGELVGLKVGGRWRFRSDDLNEYLTKRVYRIGPLALTQHWCFYRVQVLDRYRDNPRYYLKDGAWRGSFGLKSSRAEQLGRVFPPVPGDDDEAYLPEVHYWKVRLKDGSSAVVLPPRTKENLPSEELAHWQIYQINNPRLE